MEEIYQILVVEDDEVVRLLTVDALNAFGYSTLGVSLGQQALALLPTQPALQLLITDLGLPDIDGLQLATQVTDLYPKIKVLLASGYIQNGRIHQHHETQGQQNFAVISKPFTLEKLRCKVMKLLPSR